MYLFILIHIPQITYTRHNSTPYIFHHFISKIHSISFIYRLISRVPSTSLPTFPKTYTYLPYDITHHSHNLVHHSTPLFTTLHFAAQRNPHSHLSHNTITTITQCFCPMTSFSPSTYRHHFRHPPSPTPQHIQHVSTQLWPHLFTRAQGLNSSDTKRQHDHARLLTPSTILIHTTSTKISSYLPSKHCITCRLITQGLQASFT